MRRWIYFAYGVFCHLLFLATFIWMCGFVGNLLVPGSIDSAPTGVATAVGVDLLLIALFAVPHSIMARPWFKRYWTRIIPEPIERSTYVLVSSVLLAILMWQWRGLDTVIWDVRSPVGRIVLWGLFAAGWVLVTAATLMINHFDLFGTRQVWLYFKGRTYSSLPFRTPMLYKHVRHPLYLGWALAFWATPTMSLGHLVFAATLTLYMGIAAQFEERDLVHYFGRQYRDYQERVPQFIPRLCDRVNNAPADPATADSGLSTILQPGQFVP